ncbi:MAG TPA: carbohydrate binding domain-containing protein [Capsulimonadaceae bacterium]|jgi:hypothetical protein
MIPRTIRNGCGQMSLARVLKLTLSALALLAAVVPHTVLAAEVKYQSDFETPASLNGWTPAGGAVVDNETAHSGKSSLRIARTLDTEQATWTSAEFPVKEGQTYRISTWMKSAKIFMPDPSFAPEVHAVFVNALYAPAGDITVADYWKVEKDSGAVGLTTFSFDWKYFDKVLVAPSSAIACRLVFRFNKTTGTAWIDDPRVTFDPDAAAKTGGADSVGFLKLWPTRGPAGSIRSADSTIFNPGDPIDFTVARPDGVTTDDGVIRWTITDALHRTLLAGTSPVAAGKTQVIRLPNLDSQQGRWLGCKWEWRQGTKVTAERMTSVGLTPQAGFTTAGAFGSYGNPDQLSFTKRLGVTIIRSDIFWRDDIQPSEDAPVSWKGFFDQRMTYPAKYGHQTLALMSWCCPKWAWLHPDGLHDQSTGFASRPEPLRKAAFSTVQQYKDTVQYWQLGNEVNLHDKGSRDDYMIDIKAFSEGVRAADPKAKVVLGSQNRGVADIQTAVDEGVLKYVDIIDCHYYEQAALEQVRAILDKASPNKHIAIWQTEVGMFTQDGDDAYANALVKTFTTNSAAGVENIVWCFLGGIPSLSEREEESPIRTGGTYLTSHTEMPSQLFFAHYLTASQLQGAKFVKQFDFGPRGCGYLFRSGNRNVLVAWANGLSAIDGVLTTGAAKLDIADWTGRRAAIDTGGKPIGARLSFRPAFYAWDGPDATANVKFDIGGALSVKTQRDRVLYSGTSNTVTITAPATAAKPLALALDAGAGVTVKPAMLTLKPGESGDVVIDIPAGIEAPRVTLDVRQSDGAKLANWTVYEYNIKPSVAVSVDTDPLVNRIDRPGRPAWKVAVSNGGAIPVSILLTVDSLATDAATPDRTKQTVNLAKGETKTVTIPVSATPSNDRVYDMSYTADIAGGKTIADKVTRGFIGISHLDKPITIDGDLVKWSRFRPAIATGAENYYRFRADGVEWKGNADLSAKLYFAWDEAAFYLAADVRDDVHVNTKDPHDGYIWDGDSLEFALQPVTPDGNGPIVKSILALARGESASGFYGAHSPTRPGTKPDAAKVVVRRVAGHTLYEARLPWLAIYPDVAEVHVGSRFRGAALLNEDDQGKREAYLIWFGKLCWPTLGAGEFTDFVLCK